MGRPDWPACPIPSPGCLLRAPRPRFRRAVPQLPGPRRRSPSEPVSNADDSPAPLKLRAPVHYRRDWPASRSATTCREAPPSRARVVCLHVTRLPWNRTQSLCPDHRHQCKCANWSSLVSLRRGLANNGVDVEQLFNDGRSWALRPAKSTRAPRAIRPRRATPSNVAPPFRRLNPRRRHVGAGGTSEGLGVGASGIFGRAFSCQLEAQVGHAAQVEKHALGNIDEAKEYLLAGSA